MTSSPSWTPERLNGRYSSVFSGLVVLVDAEERDVEAEPRVLEVVDVAAEEPDLLLRREDQPHVGVAAVAVEVVGARPGRA